MKNIVVDYESYYSKKDKVSVTDIGLHNYIQQSEAYILSVVGEEIPMGGICGTVREIRDHLGDAFWTDPGLQVFAANSNFDQAWHEKYFPKTARPWKCVLDLGAFHQYPRNLVGLARVALGVKVDKSTRDEMDGVDYHQLPPERQEAVQRYCLNDGIQEYEILKKLPPMSPIEEKIAEHTRLCNRRGVHINTDRLEKDITAMHELRHKSWLALPWTQSGYPPLSVKALANYCATKGVPVPKSLAKTDEECGEMMDAHPALNDVVLAMRRFRRCNTLLKKAGTFQANTCDGVLPLNLFYCGASHTRRWTSKSPNVQNLDKEPVIVAGDWTPDQITEAISKGEPIPDSVRYVWSRAWVVPTPGKTFLILDFSQIEPRCLNWLAGNTELLDAIRAGYSYYEAYARAAKGWKGDKGTLKKEFGPARYTKLKNECLGCGYGMGPAKYMTYAHVPEDEARQIVSGFRKTNPKVVALWNRFDSIIHQAARDIEKNLALRMPSGDFLKHYDVRATGKGFRSTTVSGEYTNQTIQSRLWGGTLVENATQRMARDVMAEGIIRLEEAGLPVLFSCHDEVIIEVDNDASKDEAEKEARRILCTAPEWAEGLPLDVEGGFASHYCK